MLNRVPEKRVGISTECSSAPFLCRINNDENEILNRNESDDCDKDKFVSCNNHNSFNGQEIPEGSIVSDLISGIGSGLTGIFETFSPLASFVKGVYETGSALVFGTNGQLIGNLSNILQATEQNVDRGNLISHESREALGELATVVSQLQQNNNNVDLGRVITNWRNTRDAQYLLHMADHIEGGNCTSLNEAQLGELREAFIRGLRTLARAIRDAEERGESNALQHLHRAADPLVSGVERAYEAGRRSENGRLTCEDRRFMGERLQESCDCVDEGIRSGVFGGLDHSVLHELNNLTIYILDLLKDFFEEIEKEREEEEKAEKKRQCEERHYEEEQVRIFHELHKRAENKKNMFLSLMKKAMMEAFIASGIVKAELNNNVFNRARYIRAVEMARREYHRSFCSEDMYKRQASLEASFESSEQDLIESMPPASVCENESSLGFIFDTHC